MATYLRLQGPGSVKEKAPIQEGWQSPGHVGLTEKQIDKARERGDWIGMRVDPFVVIDCDNQAAAEWWLERVGRSAADPGTWVRKTPGGWHFIYMTAPGAPADSHIDVMDAKRSGIKLDVLAGRQRQIVLYAPGYEDITGSHAMSSVPVDKLPSLKSARAISDEEWDEIPEGRGNNTLTSVAGALRKQGASFDVIQRTLQALNQIAMTEDPMPGDQVLQIATSVSRYTPEPDIDLKLAEEEIAREEDEEYDEHDMIYMRGSRLAPVEPAGWLWEPYLPLSTFVSIEGAESVGKGMFVTWIAAHAASGTAFPGGKAGEGVPVLWYSAEEEPDAEILPRLRAAGWDKTRDEEIWFFNQDRHEHEPHFPADIEKVRALVRKHGIKVIILDVTRDFLYPETDTIVKSNNDEAAIRPGLRALLRFARKEGVTIIGPHHTNKIMRSDASSRERSSGSGAFRQVPRLVLKMEQVAEVRAFAVDKANNSEKMCTVRSYSIESGEDPETGKKTGVFVHGGELREYRTIDEWRQKMEEYDAEGAYDLPIDNGWKAIAKHYRKLEAGRPAPTQQQIVDDIGVSITEAIDIRAAWKKNNVVDKNDHWMGREL